MATPMSCMRRFSIRLRMLGAVATVLGLFGLVGVSGRLDGRHLAALSPRVMHHSIQEVHHLGSLRHAMGEISAAATEQRTGINSLNGAIDKLDRMAQANAVLVEQSAPAAESLKNPALRLSSVLGRFEPGAGRATADNAAGPTTPA
jgi:hypothetical protein